MSTPALYAACILIWGTTWFAITAQVDVLAPEVGVALRFGLAAAVLLMACRVRGVSLRFPRRVHALILAQGLTGFYASYVCIYQAERLVASGMVAMGYAASPLFALILARAFLGTPMSARVALGGLAGVAGVVLIYWHEWMRWVASDGLILGAGLTMAAVFFSNLASIAASSYHRRGIHGWGPLACAMAWGASAAAVHALAMGTHWGWSWRPAFTLSLLYLALVGSIVTFGGYFALVRRVGAAKAGYIGVLTPVVALAVSARLENFVWTAQSVAGIALAVAGNVVALWPWTPTREAVAV